MKHLLFLCTAVIALLLVAGCTQPPQLQEQPAAATPTLALVVTIVPTPSATTEAPVNANTILIEKMSFVPAQITVSAGSIVRWVNEGTVTNSVMFSPSTKISTYILSPSQSCAVKFTNPGVYNYSSSIYPEMQGSVVVTG